MSMYDKNQYRKVISLQLIKINEKNKIKRALLKTSLRKQRIKEEKEDEGD